MKCVDVTLEKYQDLKEASCFSEDLLKAQIMWFEENLGRWPEADELLGTNPVSSARESAAMRLGATNLSVDASGLLVTGHTNVDKLNELYGPLDVEHVTREFNLRHKNLEAQLMQLKKEVLIKLRPRPTVDGEVSENALTKEDVAKLLPAQEGYLWGETLERLRNLYGINVVRYSANDEITKIVPNASQAKGFIYQNTIYINSEKATFDTPIHEMCHLLLGELKFHHPEQYQELVQSAVDMAVARKQAIPQNSIEQEELFVTEVARWLAGEETSFTTKQQDPIIQSVARVLDTILFGEQSVRNHLNTKASIKDLATKVNAALLKLTSEESLADAALHRSVQNTKTELIKKKKLKEECQ